MPSKAAFSYGAPGRRNRAATNRAPSRTGGTAPRTAITHLAGPPRPSLPYTTTSVRPTLPPLPYPARSSATTESPGSRSDTEWACSRTGTASASTSSATSVSHPP